MALTPEQLAIVGEGWGNSGFMHSSGRVILMGGGINGEAEANKQVWVGTPSADVP